MTVVLIIVSVILLIFVVAAISPKDFLISSEIIINTTQSRVRDIVRLLDNQKKYSVRVMQDPNTVITYTGTDGQVGAIQTRDSQDKVVGAGSQEITDITSGSSYQVTIKFQRPMIATNYAKTELIAIDDTHTKVMTSFWGTSPWPMNLMTAIIKPKLLKDLSQTLTNLKALAEKPLPPIFSSTID